MPEEMAYLVGVGLAVTLAIGIGWYLRAPMLALFEKIFAEDETGRFWCGFWQVVMVLMTLIVGCLGRTMTIPGIPLFAPVVHYFTSGIVGLLMTLLAIGIVVAVNRHPISGSIPRQTAAASPNPKTAMLLKLRKRVAKVRAKNAPGHSAGRPQPGGSRPPLGKS